jgi:hypothetical protein
LEAILLSFLVGSGASPPKAKTLANPAVDTQGNWRRTKIALAAQQCRMLHNCPTLN